MEVRRQSFVERKCYATMHFLGSAASDIREGFYTIAPFMKPEETRAPGEETIITDFTSKSVLETAEAPVERELPPERQEKETVMEIETVRKLEEKSPDTDSFFKGIKFEDKTDRVKAEIFVEDVLSGLPETRTEALKHFSEISRPAAVEMLKKLLLSEKDLLLLIEIINTLSHFNEEQKLDKRIFTDFLKHQNPNVRQSAIRALSKYGDEESFSILSSCLKDKNVGVRRLALNCLSWFFRDRCTAGVLKSLYDIDDRVRKLAILICGTMRLRESVSVMITLLSDPSAEIQESAAECLRKITEQDFGFKSTASKKNKVAAIEDWRFWWRNNQAKFRV